MNRVELVYASVDQLLSMLVDMTRHSHNEADKLVLAEVQIRLSFLKHLRDGSKDFVAEEQAKHGRLRGYAYGISVSVDGITRILDPVRKEVEVVEAQHGA